MYKMGDILHIEDGKLNVNARVPDWFNPCMISVSLATGLQCHLWVGFVSKF